MDPLKMNQDRSDELEVPVHDEEVQQLLESLPDAPSSMCERLIKYQGFWHRAHLPSFKSLLAFQRNFRARDSDIIIASHPKTGTTWLKALLFAIADRPNHGTNENPLLANHPQELVHRLENIYGEALAYPRPHHLDELPSPRLLSTHLPYASLPESIKTSECRVLYIGRNPLDTCVSQWHFYSKAILKIVANGSFQFQPPSIETYFEDFFEGRITYGPFFDHLLEYWKQSLECPNKVLFLKYEDLKDDPTPQLKKLAEFVGVPFSDEEESQGVIDEIVKLCSIGNLKELDVNKTGVLKGFFEKSSYFRKGDVGDWTNYFPTSTMERMKASMEEKLGGTGLSLKFLPS